MIGIVKFYNSQKGFGYIRPEGFDENVFVHSTTLELSGISDLIDGQKIEFTLSKDQRGRNLISDIMVI